MLPGVIPCPCKALGRERSWFLPVLVEGKIAEGKERGESCASQKRCQTKKEGGLILFGRTDDTTAQLGDTKEGAKITTGGGEALNSRASHLRDLPRGRWITSPEPQKGWDSKVLGGGGLARDLRRHFNGKVDQEDNIRSRFEFRRIQLSGRGKRRSGRRMAVWINEIGKKIPRKKRQRGL